MTATQVISHPSPQRGEMAFPLDFYRQAHQWVVEADGGIYRKQRDYDEARTEWLTQRGFKVLHFANEEMLNDVESALQRIAQACGIGE